MVVAHQWFWFNRRSVLSVKDKKSPTATMKVCSKIIGPQRDLSSFGIKQAQKVKELPVNLSMVFSPVNSLKLPCYEFWSGVYLSWIGVFET